MQILHYFSLTSLFFLRCRLNYRSLHDPDPKRTDTETSAVEKQSEVLYKIHRYSSCCFFFKVFFVLSFQHVTLSIIPASKHCKQIIMYRLSAVMDADMGVSQIKRMII